MGDFFCSLLYIYVERAFGNRFGGLWEEAVKGFPLCTCKRSGATGLDCKIPLASVRKK